MNPLLTTYAIYASVHGVYKTVYVVVGMDLVVRATTPKVAFMIGWSLSRVRLKAKQYGFKIKLTSRTPIRLIEVLH